MSLQADDAKFIGEPVTLGKKGQKVTLTFSVEGLPDKSNPVVGVFDKQGKIVGRTEWLQNTGSPSFKKQFTIMHGNSTPLTFSVYNASSSVSVGDYLGGVSADLKNLMGNGGKNDVAEGGITFHFNLESAAAQGGGEKKEKAEKKVDPKVAAQLRAKLEAKCTKEGGKKAQDIAGLRDMGGVSYFHVSMEACDADFDLLQCAMDGMNKPCPEDAEERSGGADEIGKCLLSYNNDKLAIYMHVPKNLVACSIDEWYDALSTGFPVQKISGDKEFIKAVMMADPDNNIYPIKIRDDMINKGYQHLASKQLVMPDDDDEDEICMGDDDFYI
jgi:hypothetical protein